MRTFPLSALLALVGASWLGRAQATPEYPLVIDATLNVDCGEPRARCLICHTTARGGQGTAEQVFPRRLNLTRGHEPTTLRRLISDLREDQDADGDTVPDKEELRNCGNPSGDELGSGPEYGCDGAELAAPGGHDPALGVLALGLAALLVRLGWFKCRKSVA